MRPRPPNALMDIDILSVVAGSVPALSCRRPGPISKPGCRDRPELKVRAEKEKPD